ncbi:hypothetical protein C8A05DRAFT_15174 [Staphylotrichum tortipilum]|uniref:Rhodopsin domain-containing protein n=1 Tax=Staphylotrichum tortipilum TaxID=2831512 RepID=A0AAN6MM79_9PEZI|nr:hypothetical protein C8A05DRAFT_15174 [Staphylotrichum longicolle]
MRSPPKEVTSTWPAPNYINPETRGPALIIVEIVALCISTACLALRLFVRIHILRSPDWDDWLMVTGAGVSICVILATTNYGWDRHVWDLTIAKAVAGRQVSFAAQVLFVTAVGCAKISIFMSYLRIAPLGSWFRRLIYVGIALTAIVSGAILIAFFSQCRPISSYWNLARTKADCFNENPMLMAHSISGAILDFFVWALPLPTLYRAKLPLKQRLALLTLFSVGLVVVFAGCIRIYWIHLVVETTYDVTWYGFQMWLWTAVEVQLAIVCGCVPWLKSLKRMWKPQTTVSKASAQQTGPRSNGMGTISSKRVRPRRMDTLGTMMMTNKGESDDVELGSMGNESQTKLKSSDTDTPRETSVKGDQWD